jgi:hypothetical protein
MHLSFQENFWNVTCAKRMGVCFMSIPNAHRYRCVYHFTHFDNLERILKAGFLCNNHADFPNRCRSIAEPGIQDRRASMPVPCGPGGVVHDYVPLYFGSLSPMLLAVVRKKNVDQFELLYFEFPISLIARDDVVFTDASANTAVPPNFYTDPADLRHLNWQEIDSLKWSSASDELRHQRMAEVLVHSRLHFQEATRVIVWNQSMTDRLLEVVKAANVAFPPIDFESRERRHWFTKFMENQKTSIVTGPRELALDYQAACQEIRDKSAERAAPIFASLPNLLTALQANFGCLPHTAELVGLRSENAVHLKTVDAHTLDVVERLKALPEYRDLPPAHKHLVELAAFLHDIGKGPKGRWVQNGGIQKVDPDHPVRALPMMVEILSKHVLEFDRQAADVLIKLVCYHDLVGEVLGKGRDEQQIVEAFDSAEELDMLFALGKADATSLVEHWWDQGAAQALYQRVRKAIMKK